MKYKTDILIFGINNRANKNTRGLPKKYCSVLLVKDSDGKWGLPIRTILNGENSKYVSAKILEDEIGLKDVAIEKLTFKDGKDDVVVLSYMALVDRSVINNEINPNACWFDMIIQEVSNRYIVNLTNEKNTISYRVNKEVIDDKSELYKYNVTSENDLPIYNDEIIIEGIMELRNKVRNTDIVFNLMPQEFTIGELKQVYELLLNKKLINSVFRRTIASKIIVTNKQVKTGGHRPSNLCKYKGKN